MKLSKISWLILGIGIFVIAIGGLYMVYHQQMQEQEQLNSELDTAQLLLPQLISEKDNSEKQLNRLNSDLAEAKSLLIRFRESFPESVESIEYAEELFGLADYHELEVIKLTTSEPDDKEIESESDSADKEVETVTYTVTTLEVTVQGEVADMVDFVNAIVTGSRFTTATVELVEVTVPEPLIEQEEEIEEETEEELEEAEAPSATVRLVVYSYRGE